MATTTSDVILQRTTGEPARKKSSESPAGSRRVKKAESVSGKSSGGSQKPVVDPEDRMRHIAAVLMLLCGLLLLLALLSYTPHDQASAEVRPRELVGLLTNNPSIAAKADTTENWLGLLGAFISNMLFNGTAGYFTLCLPGLIGLWAVAVYKGKEYQKVSRITLYTFGVVVLLAAICGTMQLVSWMPQPAHEWSGNIGAFLGNILSGLIGKAGSILVLLAALGVTAIYGLNLDIRKIVADIREFLSGVREKSIAAKVAIDSRFGRVSTEIPAPITASAVPIPPAPRNDDEPARMMRRMRGDDRPIAAPPAKPYSEPTIRRPEQPVPNNAANNATPPPSPATRVTNPANNEAPPQQKLPLPPEPVVSKPATIFREETTGVELTHNAPTPEPVPRSFAKLTLNVQEGETDADAESGGKGALIEKLKDEEIRYIPPPIGLLEPQAEQADVNDEELKENGRILQEKLATFNIQIENLTVTPGPVVTLYEFVPAAGIKIAQIESLTDDIALALKARGIRIIAPIPGKGTVGVEIPNHKPAMVRIRSVLNTVKFRENSLRLPLALGKTTVGEVFCDDLTKMPHLLIAGATGSGKSVGINSILASLLYKMHPSDLKFVIIDPKKIELSQYRALKDHFIARCPDIDEDIITQPQNAVVALKSLEMEMDRRYDILAKVGQRNIFDYNQKVAEGKYADAPDFNHIKLPYIVLILDELADLMMTAAKEVEEPIARLAQLARAIGIHLIVATQRPSVDVITGVIKANFPARIAYQVASKIDSRTILDMNGAEYLLGNGDMLFLPGGQPKPLRLQNAFITTEEVELICEHIGKQRGYTRPFMLPSVIDKTKKGSLMGSGERDDLFEEAARLVVTHQQGSVSLIQRRLKVGYSRAARIVDELEMAGIVGPFDGSKARAVLLESEADLEAFL